MSEDRKKRNLELLRNAVDKDRKPSGAPGRGGSNEGSNRIMYRGKPVGPAGGGGGAPGAPGSSNRNRPQPERSGDGGGDVKEALRKLNQLFSDGLITKSEFEAKKAEILNRL